MLVQVVVKFSLDAQLLSHHFPKHIYTTGGDNERYVGTTGIGHEPGRHQRRITVCSYREKDVKIYCMWCAWSEWEEDTDEQTNRGQRQCDAVRLVGEGCTMQGDVCVL